MRRKMILMKTKHNTIANRLLPKPTFGSIIVAPGINRKLISSSADSFFLIILENSFPFFVFA